MKRNLVHIDQAKCNGCGQCVPSCAEGAIRIVNGKAQLVSEVYCDGLGACLGECPEGAISIVECEAQAFDEEAVRQHLSASRPAAAPVHAGCPGAAVHSFQLPVLPAQGPPRSATVAASGADLEAPPLANWPIQLKLVPPGAPFLRGADVVLVATCAAFACADFHERLLQRRPLLIGCPKLDDGQFYVEKLAEIIVTAGIRSLTVVHMEVPCCTGLVRIAQAARRLAQSDVPLEEITVSTRGQILE